MQCSAVQYAAQYNTTQTMQCNAVQCNAMQYNTMQWIQCNAIQYNTGEISHSPRGFSGLIYNTGLGDFYN